MAKYNLEFKLKIVKEYLEGNIGYASLAKKYNIKSESELKRWVNAYKTQGYEGLEVKRKNNKYTLEFKLNTVNLYLTEEGIEGLKPKKRGKPSNMPSIDKSKNLTNKSKQTKKELSEIEKLREENYYLQMEVDILKKKIQFSQMTESEIDEYLRSLDH